MLFAVKIGKQVFIRIQSDPIGDAQHTMYLLKNKMQMYVN